MRHRKHVEDNSKSCELLGKILGQEAQEKRLAKELRDITDTQPSHQVEAMHFDRPDTDVQLAGDFSIRHALSDETKNFFLPRREGMRRIGPSREGISLHLRCGTWSRQCTCSRHRLQSNKPVFRCKHHQAKDYAQFLTISVEMPIGSATADRRLQQF